MNVHLAVLHVGRQLQRETKQRTPTGTSLLTLRLTDLSTVLSQLPAESFWPADTLTFSPTFVFDLSVHFEMLSSITWSEDRRSFISNLWFMRSSSALWRVQSSPARLHSSTPQSIIQMVRSSLKIIHPLSSIIGNVYTFPPPFTLFSFLSNTHASANVNLSSSSEALTFHDPSTQLIF